MLKRGIGFIGYKIDRTRKKIAAHFADADYQKAQGPARKYCETNFPELIPLFKDSTSTGAGWTDYQTLHSHIVESRPAHVIEFGSGVTSIVMAHALQKTGGHLWTLEDIPSYHEEIKNLIPHDLKPFVTPLLRSKVFDTYKGVWGARYESLPDGPFDMVFVDGPTEVDETGKRGVCLDLFYCIDKQPNHPTAVFVDKKRGSVEAFARFYPGVEYNPVLKFTRFRIGSYE